MPATDLATRLRQLLAAAPGQQLTRASAIKSLHTTANKLDEVAAQLVLSGHMTIDELITGGRPATVYALSQVTANDARLQNIGRLIEQAVRQALAGVA